MLARSAENLYWIGRYFERAEHLSRLMEVQIHGLIDLPTRELRFGWYRIYRSLESSPSLPGSDTELTLSSDSSLIEDHILADAYILADDLTFSKLNPYSIWSCFHQGRENARQIRHRISNEMWGSLNLSYLKLQKATIEQIWLEEPEDFYVDFVRELNTFFGLASTTMYRDEGWDFLHLGKLVEHLQLRAKLLTTHLELLEANSTENLRRYAWVSLLSAYDAGWAYQRIHGIDIDGDQILNLLVSDSDLPNSMMYAITRLDDRIKGLGEAPVKKEGQAALRLAGHLKSLIDHQWPETDNRSRMVTLAESLAIRLHNRIADAWFNYPNAESARVFG